jgi:hypothetical protein
MAKENVGAREAVERDGAAQQDELRRREIQAMPAF